MHVAACFRVRTLTRGFVDIAERRRIRPSWRMATSNDTSIVSHLRPLLTGADSAYVHPSIPEKKLGNARKVHAANIPPQETILALYDGTAFGNATDGFVITSRRRLSLSEPRPPGSGPVSRDARPAPFRSRLGGSLTR